MKPIVVYPGSFCPPTYGHLQIAKKAASLFNELIIVCSDNPKKPNRLFSSQESAELWQSYVLPKNITVTTFQEIRSRKVDLSQVVMVRGVRNESDFEAEKEVMWLNKRQFGIDKFLYLASDEAYCHIASSKARELALNLEIEALSEQVAPLVVSAMLEKTLEIKNLFLVVGKPASGKSVFLKMLNKEDNSNIHLNTDEFSEILKPLLREKFGSQDFIQAVVEHEEEVRAVIAKPWLALLRRRLQSISKRSNVFVEIAFGLQSDKNMFRFVGGKVIYFGCENEADNARRLRERGTPELIPFIERIPDLEQSLEIARQNQLKLFFVNTNCNFDQLCAQVGLFNESLKKGGVEKWKLYSPESFLAISPAITCSRIS